MDQQEILNTILLTRLNYFSLAGMLELYRKVGSATLIMEHKNNLRDILPDASDKLVNAIQNSDEARKRAEVELEYDLRYGIEPLTIWLFSAFSSSRNSKARSQYFSSPLCRP